MNTKSTFPVASGDIERPIWDVILADSQTFMNEAIDEIRDPGSTFDFEKAPYTVNFEVVDFTSTTVVLHVTVKAVEV